MLKIYFCLHAVLGLQGVQPDISICREAQSWQGARGRRQLIIPQSNGPNPEDFSLPITEDEWKSMMKKMKKCGIEESKAMSMIKKRKTKSVEACTIHFNLHPK